MKTGIIFFMVLSIIMIVSTSAFAAIEVYTVKSGDTLCKISKKYGVDWKKVAESNNLENPHLIFPNQKIVINTYTDSTLINSQNILNRFKIVEPRPQYPRGIKVSESYRVLVKLASDNEPWDLSKHYTATYEAWPDYIDPDTIPSAYANNRVHISQIDTDSRVRFRVELMGNEKIDSFALKPSRYREMTMAQSSGENWIEFEVEPSNLTKHILVEINAPEQGVLNDGLMIFVNPISQIPSGNVLVLPSGVINENSPLMNEVNAIIIDENSPYDAMYIPQDTIVDGRIHIKKSDFVVSGRGMIVGSRWAWPKSKKDWSKEYPKEISPDGSVVKGIVTGVNSHFEGITTIHPYHFNFVGGETNTNLKAFGWRFSSDGVHGLTVRGCFMRVNDDHNYINKGEGSIIAYNTYWGMQNGAVFQLGWGQAAANPDGGTRIFKCNIVRGEWLGDGGDRQNNGLFSGVLRDTTGDIKDIIIDDIRVDSSLFRLIAFDMPKHDGILENFLFKNIWIEKPLFYPPGITNIIECGGGIKRFMFENLVIGNKKIMDLKDLEPIRTPHAGEIMFR